MAGAGDASLFEAVKRNAKNEQGQVVAAIDVEAPGGPETLTYRQLLDGAERLARAVYETLPGPAISGDKEAKEQVVATHMRRGCDWYKFYCACMQLQVPIVALSCDLPDKATETIRNKEILSSHRPVLLVVDDRLAEEDRLLVSSIGEAIQVVTFANLWQSSKPDVSLPGKAGSVDATLCFNYTGGTTKASRCVRVTHKMAVHEVDKYPVMVGKDVLGHTSRVLQQHSMYWAASAYGEVDIALAFGCALVFSEASSTEEVADVIQKHGVTCAGLIPHMLASLDPAEFPSLKCVFTWGEALQQRVAFQWAERVRLIDLLISTECWLSLYADWNKARAGSKRGFMTVPGAEIRLRPLSTENGSEASQPSEGGELLITGPMVSPGYVLNGSEPEGSNFNAAFLQDEDKIWYCTKDCLKWLPDETGLVFTGRADDMVKVAGAWKDMAEVKTKVLDTPGVVEASITRDAAFVVVTDDAAKQDAVLPVVRRQLPADLPVFVLQEIPRRLATQKEDRARMNTITGGVKGPPIPEDIARLEADANQEYLDRFTTILTRAFFFTVCWTVLVHWIVRRGSLWLHLWGFSRAIVGDVAWRCWFFPYVHKFSESFNNHGLCNAFAHCVPCHWHLLTFLFSAMWIAPFQIGGWITFVIALFGWGYPVVYGMLVLNEKGKEAMVLKYPLVFYFFYSAQVHEQWLWFKKRTWTQIGKHYVEKNWASAQRQAFGRDYLGGFIFALKSLTSCCCKSCKEFKPPSEGHYGEGADREWYCEECWRSYNAFVQCQRPECGRWTRGPVEREDGTIVCRRCDREMSPTIPAANADAKDGENLGSNAKADAPAGADANAKVDGNAIAAADADAKVDGNAIAAADAVAKVDGNAIAAADADAAAGASANAKVDANADANASANAEADASTKADANANANASTNATSWNWENSWNDVHIVEFDLESLHGKPTESGTNNSTGTDSAVPQDAVSREAVPGQKNGDSQKVVPARKSSEGGDSVQDQKKGDNEEIVVEQGKNNGEEAVPKQNKLECEEGVPNPKGAEREGSFKEPEKGESGEADSEPKTKAWQLLERVLGQDWDLSSRKSRLEGIDSMRVAKVIGALNREMGIKATRQDLLQCNDVGTLLDKIDSLPRRCNTAQAGTEPAAVDDVEYKAWGIMWNGTCTWELLRDRPLEEDVLRAAVQGLVERHPCLRTLLKEEEYVFTSIQMGLTLFQLLRRDWEGKDNGGWFARIGRTIMDLVEDAFWECWPKIVVKAKWDIDDYFKVFPRQKEMYDARFKVRSMKWAPPFKLGLVQPTEEGSTWQGALLSIRVTHMLSDGYSIVPILADLAQLVDREESRKAAIAEGKEHTEMNGLPPPPNVYELTEKRLRESLNADWTRHDRITPHPLDERPLKRSDPCYAVVRPKMLAILRKAARRYAIPDETLLLAAIGIAISRFDNKKVAGMHMICPQRDEQGASDLVGCLSDVRQFGVRTEDMNHLGVATQMHHVVKARKWECPGVSIQQDLPLLNFEWTDYDKKSGFALERPKSIASRGAALRSPYKIAVDQLDRDCWRVQAVFDMGVHPEEQRQRQFLTLIEHALRNLVWDPLSPVWPSESFGAHCAETGGLRRRNACATGS